MKKLTSLVIIGLFCFVGLGLTGCGGPTENTVIETTTEPVGAVQTEADMSQYEAEMRQQGQQRGDGPPAE